MGNSKTSMKAKCVFGRGGEGPLLSTMGGTSLIELSVYLFSIYLQTVKLF